MLLWELHARMELRDRHSASFPFIFAFTAAECIRLLDGRTWRDALPSASARWNRTFRFYRGRRPDGPDHEGLHGLAIVRRQAFSGGVLAEGETRHLICLDSGWLGRKPRR